MTTDPRDTGVVTIGDGPVDDAEYCENIVRKGIKVFVADTGAYRGTTLVLGRNHVDENLLRAFFRRLDEDAVVRVHSQESFLSWLDDESKCQRGDPQYERPSADHPGLILARQVESAVHIERCASISKSYLDASDWPEEGVLGAMGYHVGKSGKSNWARKQVLRRVFFAPELPNPVGREDLSEWGGPGSKERIRMICRKIFYHKQNARPNAFKSEAVIEWGHDLTWAFWELGEGSVPGAIRFTFNGDEHISFS